MSSRFGRRNRSSSKLEQSFSSEDQAKRIKHLEQSLEEKDTAVTRLEEKVKQLTQELERRKRCIDDLTSERNDLRHKNASLVGKLAELSRKQSVSSFTTLPSPPQLPKRYPPISTVSELPASPATPETPFEDPDLVVDSKFTFNSPPIQNGHTVQKSPPQSNHVLSTTKEEDKSETDYSDMEDGSKAVTPVTTTIADRVDVNNKSEFVNSSQSEIESVLAAVQDTAKKLNLVAAATHSERRETRSLSPRLGIKEAIIASREESLEAKAAVDTSQEETGEIGNVRLRKRPSVEALAALFEKAANSSSSQSLQVRSHIRQGSPHSPSPLSDTSPSESLFSETTVKRRSFSLRGEKSDSSPSTSINRTPSVPSVKSRVSPEPKRTHSGSEGIALRIANLISGNRHSSKEKNSPPRNGPKSATANMNGSVAGQNGTTAMNGGGVANQNGAVRSPEMPLSNEAVANDGTPSKVSPANMKKQKQDSVLSNMSSGFLSSGDYSTTDVDSSFDLTSPPTSPASSLGASSLSHTSTSSPTKKLKGLDARNAVNRRLEDRWNGKRAAMTQEVEWEEGEEDTLGDLIPMDSIQKMRARTKTLSTSTGLSSRTTELGRQKRTKKEIREKQFALKRHHSLTDLRLLGRTFTLKELELISPDFETKIRERTNKAVGEKYGGLERATQAAIKIQQSWRQFKLHKRFQIIKQQNKSQLQMQLRKRAQSMRDPKRRPSILRKGNKRPYHREASVAAMSPDLRAKSGLVSKDRMMAGQAKTKVPPIVRVDEQLVEQEEEVEGEMKKVVEIMEVSRDILLEEINTNTVRPPPQFQLNDSLVVAEPPVAKTDSVHSDSPDSLSPSLTLERPATTPRPLSVFSTGSSVSSSGSYQEGLIVQSLPVTAARTLPRLRSAMRIDQGGSRSRAMSVSSALQSRKRAIGINHFNRKPTKGIQYLVESQVLEDDPRSVADFLTEAKNKLSKQKIGEFVGEICSDFSMAVLGCLLEQMDMSGKPIDTALRELQQLFRMPGEAQKIDKIMEIFALEYFKHNKKNGAVKSEDAAYILSFAIMMLHTALHNPSVKHKTTKREWVSMNRGCNDGANFPEDFLLDIYDRIQSTEFVCGKDHTQEVAEIERQIIGATNLPKLTTQQRHLVLKLNVSEIVDLSKGPNFRQRHRRTVFIFNDLLIVSKQRRHEQYQCKNFFPLLHVLPVKFETEHYRNGIQLHSSIERKVLLQCTCDSLEDRTTLLEKLEETIKELEEMEKERIEELGTSLSAKPGQEVHAIGGSVRHSSTSKTTRGRSTNDLQASSSLTNLGSASLTDLRGRSYERRENEDGQLKPSSHGQVINNRSSGDSGFDSPQQGHTPVSTPTPSPTEQNRTEVTDSRTPSPSPSPSPSLIPPPASPSTLTPTHSAMSHSRSHDGIRTLTVYPSSPERPTSAELVRPNSSPSPSPSHKRSGKKEKTPKEGKEKKPRSHYVNIFSIGRARGREIKRGGSSPGASPTHKRKRRASDSTQAVHGVVRETSPSNVHMPLAQSLNLSARFGVDSLSDNEAHP